MRTGNGEYVFSFQDFNPRRRLSTTADEPPVTGHIRWLKLRAEQLLRRKTSLEFHSLCHEWWIEAYDDESADQRDARWSPHARFDLGEAGDEDFPDFPSDTEPVILGTWLSHVLESEEPNPQRKLRSRRGDGTRHRSSVRLHEMLAALALSELHQATVLLVDDPRENATTVAALLMSASELMNRSELHLWAGSRLAALAARCKRLETEFSSLKTPMFSGVKNRKNSFCHRLLGESAARPVSRKVRVGECVEPRYPLKPCEARVTRGAASLEFEYRGEQYRMSRVTTNGCLTRGFSILLDLLLMPRQDVPLLTLDTSYRHQVSVPVGSMQASSVSIPQAKDAGLDVVSDQEFFTPDEKRMEALLKRAKEARAGGDDEKADALVAEAVEINAKRTEERKKEAGARQVLANRPRLQSPDTRAAIRNAGKRLDDAMKRLEKEFPTLGRHLRAGIKTTKSVRVRYDPHPHTEWIIDEVE